MVHLDSRDVNGINIVDVEGKLNTTTSMELDKYLKKTVESGAEKILLNFESLDYISSTGLRVILGTGKKMKAQGKTLALFGMNQTVFKVFKISGFTSMFQIFDDEDQAVENI